MKKIKIFLASSNELKAEREQLEIEIFRKNKILFDEGIILHLDIWEDLSSRLDKNGSQSVYNRFVAAADLFILLAYTKVGEFTSEEFDIALKNFSENDKPFIFTYFKLLDEKTKPKKSLEDFLKKLISLKHYYSFFRDSNDLWNQFNKELERLKIENFARNNILPISGQVKMIAEKIYNISSIGNAIFKNSNR